MLIASGFGYLKHIIMLWDERLAVLKGSNDKIGVLQDICQRHVHYHYCLLLLSLLLLLWPHAICSRKLELQLSTKIAAWCIFPNSMLEALMHMSFPPRPSVDGAIGSGRQGWHGHRCCCGSAGGRGWTEFDLARGPLGVTPIVNEWKHPRNLTYMLQTVAMFKVLRELPFSNPFFWCILMHFVYPC